MSDSLEQEGLILGDRINWPYILGNAILKFQQAIVKAEGIQSPQEVHESALMIYHLIPQAWHKRDDLFKKDYRASYEVVKVDIRKLCCGVPVGPYKSREEKKLDPYKLVHACVNLLQRRGYLSKTVWIEKMVPDPSDFEELEKELDKDADSEDR